MTKPIACLVALAVLAGQVAPSFTGAAAAQDTAGALTRSEYNACQTADEAAFRRAIQRITRNALTKGTDRLDFNAIVQDQWRAGNLNAIVEKRVDVAVEQVREETSWSELIKSLAYRKQAQELATAVAERVYRSDAMKAALEELATNVGKEIGRSIVLTTSDAAIPARKCLSAYLGPRYGQTVARSVNENTGTAFTIDAKANQAGVTAGAVALETSQGIAGAVLLLVRRQMARMARRLGQRIVGSVLGRLVSVVAGGVGLVLIAKEFWELRNGVLPIIASEMKSSSSMARVQAELAKSIKEQIATHLDELAGRTSDRIIDIWHEFRRAHAKVVQLAGKNTDFKSFVDAASPAQLPQLDEIVAIVVRSEGEEGIARRLADGTLDEALNRLPPAAMQIAREQRSLGEALRWRALAGEKIGAVQTLGLHRAGQPADFTQESVIRLVNLGDRLAVTRLAAVSKDARGILFELDNQALLGLARSLSTDELATLASYLTGLGSDASQRVLRAVAQRPAAIRLLSSPRVRDAILNSRDQLAAVGMMIVQPSLLDVAGIWHDAQAVTRGDVHPRLLWDKHPAPVVAAVLFLLMCLAFLRRLFFGRRRSSKVTA